MKRVILLAILALALPSAALASTVPLSCMGGPPVCSYELELRGFNTLNHTGTGGTFTGFQFFPETPEETGGFFQRNVELFPGHLLTEVSSSNCPSQIFDELISPCFKFSGGTVSILAGGFHPVMFETSLKGGFLGVFSSTFDGFTQGGTVISATLLPNLALGIAGGTLSAEWDWQSFDGGRPSCCQRQNGFLLVRVNVVPEPGTLGLLGTGLIGLAGLARRKLKR